MIVIMSPRTFILNFFMCFAVCMSVPSAHAWYLHYTGENCIHGTGGTNGCEVPRGYCQSNLGPLEK